MLDPLHVLHIGEAEARRRKVETIFLLELCHMPSDLLRILHIDLFKSNYTGCLGGSVG